MDFFDDNPGFKEIYADAEARHRLHTTFANHFLPEYIHSNSRGFFSRLDRNAKAGGAAYLKRFLQNCWELMELEHGFANQISVNPSLPRRPAELDLCLVQVNAHPAALIRLPPPEHSREAFFIGAVFLVTESDPTRWLPDARVRIFSLEKETDSGMQTTRTGAFCEWTNRGEHRNFGCAVPADMESFRRAMVSLIQTPVPVDAAREQRANDLSNRFPWLI